MLHCMLNLHAGNSKNQGGQTYPPSSEWPKTCRTPGQVRRHREEGRNMKPEGRVPEPPGQLELAMPERQGWGLLS